MRGELPLCPAWVSMGTLRSLTGWSRRSPIERSALGTRRRSARLGIQRHTRFGVKHPASSTPRAGLRDGGRTVAPSHASWPRAVSSSACRTRAGVPRFPLPAALPPSSLTLWSGLTSAGVIRSGRAPRTPRCHGPGSAIRLWRDHAARRLGRSPGGPGGGAGARGGAPVREFGVRARVAEAVRQPPAGSRLPGFACRPPDAKTILRWGDTPSLPRCRSPGAREGRQPAVVSPGGQLRSERAAVPPSRRGG